MTKKESEFFYGKLLPALNRYLSYPVMSHTPGSHACKFNAFRDLRDLERTWEKMKKTQAANNAWAAISEKR